MQMTLLEIVQNIMSAMDSDEITSIDDNSESLQVATIVKEVYDQIVSHQIIPELTKPSRLGDLAIGSYVFLAIPDQSDQIHWIKYDKQLDGATDEAWGDVLYKEPKCFIELLYNRRNSDSNIQVVVDPNSGISLYVQDDTPPQYYTSFDDQYVCFDSFDSAVDASGIEPSKTLCMLQNYPAWEVTDGFIPPLSGTMFPFLLAEAKSVAFATLKQSLNPKIEKAATRARNWNQNNKNRLGAAEQRLTGNTGPNYGRR